MLVGLADVFFYNSNVSWNTFDGDDKQVQLMEIHYYVVVGTFNHRWTYIHLWNGQYQFSNFIIKFLQQQRLNKITITQREVA